MYKGSARRQKEPKAERGSKSSMLEIGFVD